MLALRAFRTSPVAGLYVEADEPSLYSRREKLSLQYSIRLAANPSNRAHEVTFDQINVDLYEQNLKLLNHLETEFHHSSNLLISNHKMLKKTFYNKYSSFVRKTT